MVFQYLKITFLAMLFFAGSARADVILELEEGDRPEPITLQQQVEGWLEVGRYFDTNYPDKEINEDLSEDLAKFYPSLPPQELFDRARLVRDIVKIYRFGTKLYTDIKEKMIAPEAPPLIVADEDYEAPYEDEYIPTKEGVVVIEDFKKVLSYGSNMKDRDAYNAKLARDAEKKKYHEMTAWERLTTMVSKLEIKKLPFYGIIYENPFVGHQGMGEFAKQDDIKVRLVNSMITTNNQEELRIALQILLPKGKTILAQPHGGFDKPQYSFEGSENLDSFSVFSPRPTPLINDQDQGMAIYSGDVSVPILVKLKNTQKPLNLKLNLKISVCEKDACKNVELSPSLKLYEGESIESDMNFYVNQAFMTLPVAYDEDLELLSLKVDEPTEDKNSTQVLRATFKAHKSIDKFEVFAESKDGIKLSRPRVAINDNVIVARFFPLNKSIDLKNKEFTITAAIDFKTSIRQTLEAVGTDLWDTMRNKLSLGLILFGILGGFILNFMPCVFPVLSLKILSLSDLGEGKKLKKDFVLTVVGIFSAMLIIAAILSAMKFFGLAIGWGMQFQNPTFLVCMIFIIVLFMSHIWGQIKISIPFSQNNGNGFVSFLSGNLAVLMSTPCTAPYLGTAIGFALVGSITDIFAIMLSIAFGLSIPYLFLLTLPNAAKLFPKPGRWMDKLNKFMIFMLFLTIVWLLSILSAQTSIGTAFKLSGYTFGFLTVLWFRKMLIDNVEEKLKGEEEQKVTGCFFQVITLILLIAIFAFALSSTTKKFDKTQNVIIRSREKNIDIDSINSVVKSGRTVLVRVGADWCLTCSYNNAMVFNMPATEELIKNKNVEVIDVDWTNYNEEVLAFMAKFGRMGLPFYIIFSPSVPDGIVLPEVLTDRDFTRTLNGLSE